MTDVEKELFCGHYGVTSIEMLNPLFAQIKLDIALNLINISKQNAFDISSVITFYLKNQSIEEAYDTVIKINNYVKYYGLSDSQRNIVTELCNSGYEVKAAAAAEFAAGVLNLPVRSIIRDTLIYDVSRMPEKGVSISQGENDTYILDSYHIDYAKISALLAYADYDALSLYIQILSAFENASQIDQGSNTTNSDTTTNDFGTTSNDNATNTAPVYTKEYTAPYQYDKNQTQVSPLDGSVRSAIKSFSIPGKNGLDVTIAPSYNSRNAGFGEEDYNYSSSWEYLWTEYTVEIYSRSYYWEQGIVKLYLGDGSSTLKYKLKTTDFDKAMTAIAENYKEPFETPQGGPGKSTLYTEYSLFFDGSEKYDLYTTKENVVNSETYNEKTEQLGAGWTWGFPSIENNEGIRYLHLGNGQIYQIKPSLEAGQSNLINYKLKDLSMMQDSTYTQTQTQKKSGYVLKGKDGSSTYFAADGTLLSVLDRYGNKIDWIYEPVDGKNKLKKIIDTLGREYIFNEILSNGGKDVTVTLPDQRVLTYRHTRVDAVANDYLLTEFIDPIGNVTKYTYNTTPTHFTFFDKTNRNGVINYGLLKEVIYPTSGREQFFYEMTVENFGSVGSKELSRAVRHEVIDGLEIKENYAYTYSANNSSGYPEFASSSNLPAFFTTQTTVKTDTNIKVVTFNNKQLNTKEVLYSLDNKRLSEQQISYDDKDIPNSITKRNVNPLNNAESVFTESFTYDEYGNLTSQVDAIGNKTSFSYYTNNYHLPQKTTVYNGSAIAKSLDYGLNNASSKNIDWLKTTNLVNGVDKSETTNFEYDSYGNKVRTVTKSGTETLDTMMTYDPAYQGAYLTSITTENMTHVQTNGLFTKQSVPSTTKYEYNFLNGQQIATIDTKKQ